MPIKSINLTRYFSIKPHKILLYNSIPAVIIVMLQVFFKLDYYYSLSLYLFLSCITNYVIFKEVILFLKLENPEISGIIGDNSISLKGKISKMLYILLEIGLIYIIYNIILFYMGFLQGIYSSLGVLILDEFIIKIILMYLSYYLFFVITFFYLSQIIVLSTNDCSFKELLVKTLDFIKFSPIKFFLIINLFTILLVFLWIIKIPVGYIIEEVMLFKDESISGIINIILFAEFIWSGFLIYIAKNYIRYLESIKSEKILMKKEPEAQTINIV